MSRWLPFGCLGFAARVFRFFVHLILLSALFRCIVCALSALFLAQIVLLFLLIFFCCGFCLVFLRLCRFFALLSLPYACLWLVIVLNCCSEFSLCCFCSPLPFLHAKLMRCCVHVRRSALVFCCARSGLLLAFSPHLLLLPFLFGTSRS